MAELATIARPYADALFKVCGSDHRSTLNWLEELACVAQQPLLLEFSQSPMASSDQVYEVVTSVMKTQPNHHTQNFLRLIIANHRLTCLPDVSAQFRALVNARSGVCDAIIYSAFPMEGQALIETTELLEKRFARKLHVSVQLQPDLIGGIRVVVGDEVLDTSVRARLEQMKVALSV